MNTDDPETYGQHVSRYTAFTAPYNASGNPAVTVPLHWTANGMPVGVQLGGRYGDEATLLAGIGAIGAGAALVQPPSGPTANP